jgi:hypothetical protein
VLSPINLLLLPSHYSTNNVFLRSSPLSSYATPPEGVASVPSFSLSMGTRTSGEEEFPPLLGVDDFAIVNPDFWDLDETRNDRSQYHGWMGFAEVSVSPF